MIQKYDKTIGYERKTERARKRVTLSGLGMESETSRLRSGLRVARVTREGSEIGIHCSCSPELECILEPCTKVAVCQEGIPGHIYTTSLTQACPEMLATDAWRIIGANQWFNQWFTSATCSFTSLRERPAKALALASA